MGYSCRIRSNKEIKREDVQKIIDRMPEHYQSTGLKNWGWNMYCDISFPQGDRILISGESVNSGYAVEEFVDHFMSELISIGHKLEYKWSW